MADNTINVRIKDRSDTEANWTSKNPVLLKGERAITDGTGKYKIGDGKNTWGALPYYEAMTSADRTKLNGIASGANKTTVDSSLSSSSTNPVQNKVVNSALAGKSNTNHTHDLSTMINTLSTSGSTPTDDDYFVSQYAGGGTTTTTYHRRPVKALLEYIKGKLAKVATSGSYNDLSNKPTIPSVGNGTITIKQAGAVKGSFTTNQSGATTIELTDNNTNTWRDVVNNLASTATDKSLSAAQGKILNESKLMHKTINTSKTDFNSLTETGIYHITITDALNAPVSNRGTLYVDAIVGTKYQVFMGDTVTDRIFKRIYNGTNKAWTTWTTQKLTDTVYTHPNYTAKSNGLYKVTVDSTGHVSGTAAVTKGDITALGIPSTNTTYSTGTASTSGLTKLYTGTGTATDGTMTQAAIKSALDGKSDTGHTHVSLDKIGSVAYIGSDKANTAGWYKVYSTTLTGYSNHVARLLFTYGYSNIGSAILDLHIRCDNATTIYVRELKWESRTGTAFLPGDAIINTNGNTWTLYVYNHQNQYGRMKVRVLESTNTSSNWDMEIKSNDTPESATPTATVTSSDGGSVNYANSAGAVAWGNVTGKPSTFTPSPHTHDDRYYTESEMNTKLSGKSNTGHTHTKSQITDFPTSMPASDVAAWAKAATKPTYTKSEVGLGNVDNTADANKSVKYATSAGSATSAGNASKVNNHTVNADVPSGAKFTDTVYSHPTTSGNKHIPSGGSSGQILRWSSDGTAVWGNDNNTTYTLSSITGTLAVSKGGTGSTTAAGGRSNLGAVGFVCQSAEPSGQNNGDLWFKEG